MLSSAPYLSLTNFSRIFLKPLNIVLYKACIFNSFIHNYSNSISSLAPPGGGPGKQLASGAEKVPFGLPDGLEVDQESGMHTSKKQASGTISSG